MEWDAALTAAPQPERSNEYLVRRAFLMAYLLTGSSRQAECAALEAIDSWNPEQGAEVLFHNALAAAARTQIKQASSTSNEPDVAGLYLPAELQAVLKLAPRIRRCFVLRILVGLSPRVCAHLLKVHSRRVDRDTCAALHSLRVHGGRLAAYLEDAA